MKKTTFFFLLFFVFHLSYAQEIDERLPYSWTLNLNNRVTTVELPPIDLTEVMEQDIINDRNKTLPWRYGVIRPVEINLQNQGVWTPLPNGSGEILQLKIKSPGAKNLGINFNEFYLPEGAFLHIYNKNQSEISKTYTYSSNPPDKTLGSWFVSGEVIYIEYFEPTQAHGKGKLKIESIVHGYRMGTIEDIDDAPRGINDSGDCNYDVNCPIGNDFNNKKDILKKAVALINLGNGHLCSGVLVNTTVADRTPYLLTANHCLENSNPSLWSVRFNWMSPNPICGSDEESIDVQNNFTMSGVEVKANNTLSDFALVELNNRIPNSWDVVFAGWDNSDVAPLFEVGIHHPNGDIMKICRDNSGAIKENAAGTLVWLIKGISAGNGDGWEIGTTESGSSGSPLFNQNGKIIGQLYSGQAYCDGTASNNDYDIYGRFGVSWNGGANENTRLKDWLDPIHTGQTSTETLQNILNIPDNEFIGDLKIYPNPASSTLTIINNRYPNLTYRFMNVLGQSIKKGSLSNTTNILNVEDFSEGIYFLHLIDEDSNSEITKKIIINR